MSASRALGIDLSDGTVKAVLLVRRGRRALLRAAWRVELDPRAELQPAALQAVAELLATIRPGPSTQVVLSAPTELATSRSFHFPLVDAARTAELVEYELLAELQRPADDLVMRHLARRAPREQPVHAYALRRDTLEAFRNELSARSVPWDELHPPGYALASLVDAELPAARDRVILGVGQRATQLVLLTEDGLWMRQIPLGLQHDSAEGLATRLLDELHSAVTFLLPTDRPFAPESVVLTEDGAGDARFTSALKRASGLTVTRLATLERRIRVVRPRLAGATLEQALGASKAAGLALGALGLARFHCPVVDGVPRRQVARQFPLVAASVCLSAAALIGLGELARWQTARLHTALPITLHGEWLDRARQREDLSGEVRTAEARAAALLTPGLRRSAVLAPRRVLAALAPLTDERAGAALFVDTLWLSAGTPDSAGLVSLTVLADPALEAVLPERIEAALRVDFRNVRVSGPQEAPRPEWQRWTVEAHLP